MSDILRFLNSHASVRKFSGKEISTEDEEKIIYTAQRSATSSNLHAYTVIGIRNQKTKDKLAELSGGQSHVAASSLFLVFCADLHRLKMINDSKNYNFTGEYTEQFIIATVDASLVACRALQAAQAMGMGGVMVGGLRTGIIEVSELLELPEFVYPVMGLSLGYPESEPMIKPRLPLDGIYCREKYSDENFEQAIAEYDNVIDELGYLKGREVESEKYPEYDGDYNWSEHTARRIASDKVSATRPHMMEYLQKRGFIRK